MARIVEESYIKDLCEWIINCEKNYELDMSRTMAEIKEDIENMKELVRCKDCDYFVGDCDKYESHCRLHAILVDEDDFCSYGERKDNERKAD